MNNTICLPKSSTRALMMLLLLLSAVFAHGQETIWTGANSNQWSDAANWSAGLPVAGGVATVPSASPVTPLISGAIDLNYFVQNFSLVLIDAAAVITNSSYFANYSGATIKNEGILINEGSIAFDNDGTFDNIGTFHNFGSLDNGGPNSTAVFNNYGKVIVEPDSYLVNTGVFNNFGEIINQSSSLFNYYKFVNKGTILNEGGTLENFSCAEFIQWSNSHIGGNFWNLGVLYLLSGSVNDNTMMGGVVLTNLSDKPMPMAMCKNLTITLGTNGTATISTQDINNMSMGPCYIKEYGIDKANFDCSHVGENVVTLTVTDFNGYSSSCTAVVTVLPSDACRKKPGEYCSFTQGFYGNAGGKQNGQTTIEIIRDALSDGNGNNQPIVLGKPGRSLKVDLEAALCIIKLLPGGGPADKLPSGNVVLGSACHTGNIPLKNGRFFNILLAQTLTMALNLRYDNALGNLKLSETCINLPYYIRHTLGSSGKVSDLLALANKALGGDISSYYFSSLVEAVSKINEAFDECSVACQRTRCRESDIFHLSAALKGLSVDLAWTTGSGYATLLYEVERSVDGADFQSILTMENPYSDNQPRVIDAIDTDPATGILYYRVKQTFDDGTAIYTPAKIVINLLGQHDAWVYPNPASHAETFIALNAFVGKSCLIKVVNQYGVEVFTQAIQQVGVESIRLDLSGMADGIYHVYIQSDGRKAISKSLIINQY